MTPEGGGGEDYSSDSRGLLRAVLPPLMMIFLGTLIFLGDLNVNAVLLPLLMAAALAARPHDVPHALRFSLYMIIVFTLTGLAAQLVVGTVSLQQLVLGMLRLVNLVFAGLVTYGLLDPVTTARLLCRVSPTLSLYYLASLRMLVLAQRSLSELWGVIRVNSPRDTQGFWGRASQLRVLLRSLVHSLLEESLMVAEAQYLRGHMLCGGAKDISQQHEK